MPDDDLLERLFHRAVRFPDPTARIAALRVAFEATEAAISHQADQLALRTVSAMKGRGGHPDDIDYELHALRETTEELFPRIFRGGFLVSTWSVFESGIKDLAEYTRKHFSYPFGLQDLRAGDFLQQTERFFKDTIQVIPFPDKSTRKKIELFKGFRNALAHHDGNLEELPAELRNSARAFVTFSDLHHTFAVPTAEYNLECVELAQSVSSALAQAIYEHLHPEPKGGA